jgi:hypothetical protein
MSIIIFSHGQPSNIDGFLYLTSAAHYIKDGFASAYSVYKWPFFSILIAWIYQLSDFSLLTSAYILVTFLDILLVVSFTFLTQIIYKKPPFVWLGILTIFCFKNYNHLRADILRDHGYWAFSVLAIACLLKLAHSHQWRYGFAWGLLMSIAGLFRIEGFVILLFTPLIFLVMPDIEWKKKMGLLMKAESIILIAGAVLLVFITQFHSFNYVGRLSELQTILLHPILNLCLPFQEAVLKMQQYVLSIMAKGSGGTILMSGTVGILLMMLISTLSFFYGILAGYGMIHKVIPSKINSRLLYGILVLNLLVCFFFILKNFFLSERYILLFCLIAMLWIPGTVYHLYCLWHQTHKRQRWLYLFACIGFLYLAIGSIGNFGTSKTYLADAGKWLSQEGKKNNLVITNSPQICFLASDLFNNTQKNRDCQQEDFTKKNLNQELAILRSNQGMLPIYFAININHIESEENLIPEILKNQSPLAVFQNRRGDKLLIFAY